MRDNTLYNRRVWLNSLESPSTGSLVLYAGDVNYNGRIYAAEMFIEVASCNHKVRLHRADGQSKADFCDKLHIMERELREFREFLEAQPGPYRNTALEAKWRKFMNIDK